MRELERVVLLQQRGHQVDGPHRRHGGAAASGIYLRSYGQRDPVVEYRIEGFDMFDEMVASIREDTSRMLLTVRSCAPSSLSQREQVAKPTGESGADDGSVKKQPVRRRSPKPGRNDPCPCGSGKKFKKCTCEQYKDLRS